MSEFDQLATDRVCVESLNGARSRWFNAIVEGDSCEVFDESFDAEVGSTLVRKLPNDREEMFSILRVDFNGSSEMIPSSCKLSLDKMNQKHRQSSVGTVFNISGSSNFQAGNYNVQNIKQSITELQRLIESADIEPARRDEVKGLLGSFLRHPAVVAILGGISGSV